MKTNNFYTKIALTALAAFSIVAGATPTIDSITVQGYMRNSTNTSVTNGTYNIAYMVLQGGAVVWGKEYSTVVTNGLFSKTLSGVGQDLTAGGAWANCTGEANFSAATLNPALLIGAGAGATVVRVCSRSMIDSVQPEFDVTVAAAPTAFVADTAYGVVAGSLSVAAFAATAYTNTSAGAGDANKLVQLDAGGLIDTTMLPVVPVALGGTGSTTAGGALTALGAAENGVNNDITEITGLTTMLALNQGGTGKNLTAVNGGVVYTDADSLEVSAAGTAGDILTSGGAGAPTWTTTLPIANGGTNNAALGVTDGGIVYADGSKLMTTAAGTSGQVLTSAGTGVPTWSSVSQNSARTSINIFEDFLASIAGAVNQSVMITGQTLWTATNTAGLIATTTAAAAAGDLGVLTVTMGATANATGALAFCGANAVGTPRLGMRFEPTDTWTFEARLNVSGFAANTGILRIGLLAANTAVAQADIGAYWEQTNGASTMTPVTRNGGGVVTGTTSTVTAATYAIWRVSYDGAGNVTFFKDGAQVGAAVTGNVPSSTALCPGIFFRHGAAGATRTIPVDYMTYTQTTSSR